MYVDKAFELRNENKYQESLVEIEKHGVCDKSEIRMSYHYHKGWTLYEMGRYEAAIEEYLEGLKTEPTYFFAYWRLGLAYESLGDAENARKAYRNGYEVGVKEYGQKFFESMENNPEVKLKLIHGWNA